MSEFNRALSDLSIAESRRSFLLNSGMGIGASAFASLIASNGAAAKENLITKTRAKRVIFLFMAGAPSQVDLFDHKPEMHKLFKTACGSDHVQILSAREEWRMDE